MNNNLMILGVMSGTSLDGIDLALCKFIKDEQVYRFDILKTECVGYSKEMKLHLSEAHLMNTSDFLKFHKNYGRYIGKNINTFLKDVVKPQYISSHGHTVFHNPAEQFTFQIGDGAFIAAETGISVISDFRNLDLALSGQGAPLVPIGDKLLFPEYDYCINLGGFANISYDLEDNRIAYDICPVNFVLNKLVNNLGYDYDKNGELGKGGLVNRNLFNELNRIPYYSLNYPKSLARENVETHYFPVLNKYEISIHDKLRTYYEHIIFQIKNSIQSEKKQKVLITGGGAHNRFLINLLRQHIMHEIVLPDKDIIDFKEALIFAFLGYLRVNNQINSLSSVTGAEISSSGGNIYLYKKINDFNP